LEIKSGDFNLSTLLMSSNSGPSSRNTTPCYSLLAYTVTAPADPSKPKNVNKYWKIRRHFGRHCMTPKKPVPGNSDQQAQTRKWPNVLPYILQFFCEDDIFFLSSHFLFLTLMRQVGGSCVQKEAYRSSSIPPLIP
jgi:hypothetical protein